MRRQAGFTLIEIMVVIAILGILAVTAMPFYQTWTQRAYGIQATAMMRSLMDGQIMHNLENNAFYPPGGGNVFIFGDSEGATETEIRELEVALKVAISRDGRLQYQITNYGEEGCYIIIRANFPLFKDGHRELHGHLDGSGRIYVFPAG